MVSVGLALLAKETETMQSIILSIIAMVISGLSVVHSMGLYVETVAGLEQPFKDNERASIAYRIARIVAGEKT